MEKTWKHTFKNDHTVELIQVNTFEDLSTALPQMGFHKPRPTLVLVGGASGISEADKTYLQQIFIDAIAPIAQELNVTVVDGGTDSGVMRFMGQARSAVEATFPLIGVAAIGTVKLPGNSPLCSDAADLEPNHTHFVLVPGSNWGDESPWIAYIAGLVSQGFPSITVVINGGEITFRDVSNSVQADRPVITLDGSGRTADKLAAALRGEATDARAKQLAASELLQAIDLIKNPAQVTPRIKQILSQLLHI